MYTQALTALLQIRDEPNKALSSLQFDDQLAQDLPQAIAENELFLVYQPIIDLPTSKITALEALIRWQHPTLGLLHPTQFIPIAEQTGEIIPIGEWVLKTACNHARAWQIQGCPVLMAVNLSPCQLKDPELVKKIRQTLHSTGLHPSLLELEITESQTIEDIQRLLPIFNQLRDLGVGISLDDFGTGCSSFQYLQNLPITTLKIDRSFVDSITTNLKNAAIANVIIGLAASLDLRVVAEGVETQEQLDFLKKSGCYEAQGFYFTPIFRAFLSGGDNPPSLYPQSLDN